MKIAFLKSDGGIIDWLIKFWTRGPYVHCAIIFSDKVWFESSPLHGCRFFYDNENDRARYDFINIKLGADEEKIIRNFCASRNNRGYDWLGIFLSQIFPFDIDDPKKLYCSELVVRAFHHVDLLKFLKPTRSNPNNLYKSLIYETENTRFEF